MKLSTEASSSLLSIFDHVLREAFEEIGAPSAWDRERTCVLAADAFIAFAKAGLHPEQIGQFTRSNLRFMGSVHEAAAVM
jgi:hypothetical protein